MPKFRYSWPFYLVVLGNIFMWEEIFTSSLFNFMQNQGAVADGEIYRVFVFTLFSFGLYGLSAYYIWDVDRLGRELGVV